LPVGTIKELHLQGVLMGVRGKSRSLVSRLRSILKSIFGKAVKNEVIGKNPAEALALPEHVEGHHRSMNESERKYFLLAAAATNPRRICDKKKIFLTGLFYKTMYYCGLRGGEVAALTVRDVDDRLEGFHVTAAIKKDGTYGPPKSSKGIRFVPIPEPFFTEIKAYIGDKKGKDPDDFIFTQLAGCGKHHTDSSRRKMWLSLKKEMSFLSENPIGDDLTPHCLRHTYCTDALLAGVYIQVVSELMGHTDIKTTEIYDSHPPEALKTAKIRLTAFHQEYLRH
jgi:integrase